MEKDARDYRIPRASHTLEVAVQFPVQNEGNINRNKKNLNLIQILTASRFCSWDFRFFHALSTSMSV